MSAAQLQRPLGEELPHDRPRESLALSINPPVRVTLEELYPPIEKTITLTSERQLTNCHHIMYGLAAELTEV